jgi:2-keto-4-pentenoate hydratase/2-oxohepta-3-ene-1,7-dioic acid hydratase in catechol pathway
MARTGLFLALAISVTVSGVTTAQEPTTYVRYELGGNVSYGVLEGDTIHELRGDIFDSIVRTGDTVALGAVRVLSPTAPKKVVAIGFNYGSHLGDAEPAAEPGVFAKYPTSVVPHDSEITYYADATDLHYEGEMVLIIGRTARNVPKEEANDYIFAVAPGNDVSERAWQRDDLQWFRAKGADTFGPVGPVMVAGVDYNNILLQTRLNGDVVQSQRTEDLIFDTASIVSYVSKYLTLEAGDMIFTGTPGSTKAMKPGDVVEVELENVGILRNTVGPKQKD